MRPMSSCPIIAWIGTPNMPGPGPAAGALLLHERAVALVHRPERLLGGNDGALLVVVPRALRLRRLLHLEQVRGMHLSPVGANGALAEERIVRGRLLHLRDHLRAVV